MLPRSSCVCTRVHTYACVCCRHGLLNALSCVRVLDAYLSTAGWGCVCTGTWKPAPHQLLPCQKSSPAPRSLAGTAQNSSSARGLTPVSPTHRDRVGLALLHTRPGVQLGPVETGCLAAVFPCVGMLPAYLRSIDVVAVGLTARLFERGPHLSLPAGAALCHTCPFPAPCPPSGSIQPA